ncbi:hypothetical protein [Cupriavidus taiwanensis]|uniref:hypothetical protein n=1 Tax=Cupriavidus taiwanensis TaxID=164546 RepID=UPI000E1021C0|nr:hypothetical protein [Cupriavidus taiwanensis]SPD44089.1 protein of unknown function [Cupriavidus taiwanensis]
MAGRSAGEVARDVKARWMGSTGGRLQVPLRRLDQVDEESFGYAVSALALAVIFIYMILASQFASFFSGRHHDLAALTLAGVFAALLLFARP